MRWGTQTPLSTLPPRKHGAKLLVRALAHRYGPLLNGIVPHRPNAGDTRCPMTLDDHRLLSQVAYGEWKRCHAAYLDLACQIASGSQISPATITAVRADVERAMADLASMGSHSTEEPTIAAVRAALEHSLAEFVSISRQSAQPSPTQAA